MLGGFAVQGISPDRSKDIPRYFLPSSRFGCECSGQCGGSSLCRQVCTYVDCNGSPLLVQYSCCYCLVAVSAINDLCLSLGPWEPKVMFRYVLISVVLYPLPVPLAKWHELSLTKHFLPTMSSIWINKFPQVPNNTHWCVFQMTTNCDILSLTKCCLRTLYQTKQLHLCQMVYYIHDITNDFYIGYWPVLFTCFPLPNSVTLPNDMFSLNSMSTLTY